EWKSPVSNSYRDYNKDDLDKHQDVWYHDFSDNADHNQQDIYYNHHECPGSTNNFNVAIISASQQELTAVKALFDEDYGIVGDISGVHPLDTNAYVAGRIGNHKVILTQISKYGKVFAAKTSFWLSISFPQIRICLVVSTGAGVPCTKDGQEIRLGDVLVSEGIIEYDLGKLLPGG
ncbi:hypothetical protein KXX47_008859, partial [Aspergillus fumigatus]